MVWDTSGCGRPGGRLHRRRSGQRADCVEKRLLCPSTCRLRSSGVFLWGYFLFICCFPPQSFPFLLFICLFIFSFFLGLHCLLDCLFIYLHRVFLSFFLSFFLSMHLLFLFFSQWPLPFSWLYLRSSESRSWIESRWLLLSFSDRFGLRLQVPQMTVFWK